MCTLIVATRAWPDTPLLVAANRDESLDRPAKGPNVHSDGPIPVLAPTDLRAGGTWLGVSALGVFAGLTNRYGHKPDPERNSRGLIPHTALTEPDAGAAAERIARLDPRSINPFHLVTADRSSAHLVWHDGEALHREELSPGIHVYSERSLGAEPSPREARIRASIGLWSKRAAPSDETLADLLAQHDDDPFNAVCVHADRWNYGTRSSILMRLTGDATRSVYRFGDGPTCRTDHQDLSPQFRKLLTWRPPDGGLLDRHP